MSCPFRSWRGRKDYTWARDLHAPCPPFFEQGNMSWRRCSVLKTPSSEIMETPSHFGFSPFTPLPNLHFFYNSSDVLYNHPISKKFCIFQWGNFEYFFFENLKFSKCWSFKNSIGFWDFFLFVKIQNSLNAKWKCSILKAEVLKLMKNFEIFFICKNLKSSKWSVAMQIFKSWSFENSEGVKVRTCLFALEYNENWIYNKSW